MTPGEAKAWLIQQIVSEAERTGTTLDPLETGMLEYSETARTPPDFEALNQAFDRVHDQGEYEAKLAALIREMLAGWHAESNPKLSRWKDAMLVLSKEDHYLPAIIARANPQHGSPKKQEPQRSWLRLFLVAILLTTAITLLLDYLAAHLR